MVGTPINQVRRLINQDGLLRLWRHLYCLTLRHFCLRTVKRFVYGAIVTENIIVIVRLVCDMVQTQHESRGRVLCLYHIAH